METVTVVEEEMQTTANNIYTNTSDLYVAEEINSFFFYEVSIRCTCRQSVIDTMRFF